MPWNTIPESSRSNRLAFGFGVTCVSYWISRSLFTNYIYPTLFYISRFILVTIGASWPSLNSPIHVTETDASIDPWQVETGDPFLDYFKGLPVSISTFRGEPPVPAKTVSILHFWNVMALKFFITLGSIDESDSAVQSLLRIMASPKYSAFIRLHEDFQLSLSAVLLGHVFYKWTLGVIWKAQKSGKFIVTPDRRDKFIASVFSPTGICSYKSQSKVWRSKMGNWLNYAKPLFLLWLLFLNVSISVTTIPVMLSKLADSIFSSLYRFVGPIFKALGLQNTLCRYLRIGVKSYNLQGLDFSTRMGLASSLTTHVRRARFYDGAELHSALLQASENKDWKDRAEFAKCKPQLEKFTHAFDFLRWFLEWNTSPGFSTLAAQESAEFTTTIEKVTTYDQTCEVFKALDQLPYLSYDFPKVFHRLTSEGALSHPPIARALVNHYAQYPSYFQFFKALDRRWWSISQQVEGHPSERKSRYCFREAPPKKSAPQKNAFRPEQAHTLLPEQAFVEKSNFSLLFLQPHFTSVLAFWHLSSPRSYISPQLVTELGLTPVTTGNVLQINLGGTGNYSLVEQTVSIEFKVPGIEGDFCAELVVFDSKIAPIILGEPFWISYHVCVSGRLGVHFEDPIVPVATICPSVASNYREKDERLALEIPENNFPSSNLHE